MKNLILVSLLFLAIPFLGVSQDTSVYNLQRNKVNALLWERSQRFGQYDQSLNERTGIFGFQTKKDIKRSNEILRQIALNDNEIFKQLKVLLDYKDLQVQEVKTTVNTSSESLLNYRTTIKNLQQQNQQLSKDLDKKENSSGLLYALLILTIIAIIYLVYKLNNKNKIIRLQKSQLRVNLS